MNYLSLFIEFLIRLLAGSVVVIGLVVLLEKVFKIKEKTPKRIKAWMVLCMGIVAGMSVGERIIESIEVGNIEVGKGIRIALKILTRGGICVLVAIILIIVRIILTIVWRRRLRVKG